MAGTEVAEHSTLIKQAVRFTHELGGLRVERDSGFKHIREDPCSVAEHTQRAAALGFLIASICKKTGEFSDANPPYVAALITFHDAHEVRLSDLDKIRAKYLSLGMSTPTCPT